MMNNLKPNDVGDESITTVTKNESTKNGCVNITKLRKYPIKIVDGKRVWYKNCPLCNREQQYSTLRAISSATKKNKHCLCCKNGGVGNPFFGKHHTEEHKHRLSNIQLKTCSHRYKRIGKNPPKIQKNCNFCGVKFEVTKCNNRRKYCSYWCAINDNFGFDPLKKTEPEKKFELLLQTQHIGYKSPYPLKGKLYDFYIPSKNTLIEIDGIYWHGKGLSDSELNETQTKNRINDKIKTCIAHENGYTLIRIWEDEIGDICVSKYFC